MAKNQELIFEVKKLQALYDTNQKGVAELLPVLAEEAKTITVETINVMDITE